MGTPGLDTLLRYIAANVRRLRQKREMTQEALAEITGRDLRFVQKVETGRHNLSLATLVALAEALQVSPGALLRPAALPKVQRGRPRKARPS